MRFLARAIPGLVLALALLAPPALGAATHAEYVAQVNPICSNAKRQAAKIPSQIKPTGNRFTDFLLRIQRFGKLLGKTTKRIAAVTPAPGEETAVSKWIAGLRQQKRLIERYLRAVGHGNVKQANNSTRRIARVEKRNQRAAGRLGITACASGDQPG
jgi:hypothetical protein